MTNYYFSSKRQKFDCTWYALLIVMVDMTVVAFTYIDCLVRYTIFIP